MTFDEENSLFELFIKIIFPQNEKLKEKKIKAGKKKVPMKVINKISL